MKKLQKGLAQSLSKGFTLIELLVVIGILAVLLAITLIAINPARQFGQANNTERRSEVLQILNAIHQYAAENQGNLPGNMPAQGDPAEDIADTGADLCADLVPTYISALPTEPSQNVDPVTDCTAAYDTGYQVSRDTQNRVTVSSPVADLGETISVTR